ncbi:MAG: hypothetical protein H0X63_03060 [Flavobacteriales bacterium]|nr:hypothetical protein [Flavobacteriales bacterium]
MKNNLKKIFLLGIIGLVISCSDTEKEVDRLFDGTTRGAVLRTIPSESSLVFRVGVPDEVKITVDVIDVEMGGLAEKIDVFLSFSDNNPDDGDNSFAETLIETIPASAFVTGGEFPRVTITLNGGDIQSQFGLTEDDYTGGDVFKLRLALTLTDGRVFTDTNVSNIVAGGLFYRSPFVYNISVTCPLGEDFIVGMYNLEVIEGVFPAFGATIDWLEGPVQIIQPDGPTSGRRQIVSACYLPEFGTFCGPFNFELVCNEVLIPEQAAGGGVGCGAAIILNQNPNDVGIYDPLDDTVFELIYQNNINNSGNCAGASEYRQILRLTKI